MEIQTIVDRLNSPPFDKNYSLVCSIARYISPIHISHHHLFDFQVAFDEKSPEELLELFLDVLGELDKTYKV